MNPLFKKEKRKMDLSLSIDFNCEANLMIVLIVCVFGLLCNVYLGKKLNRSKFLNFILNYFENNDHQITFIVYVFICLKFQFKSAS